ncbi:DivIVA domain-containing protein [Saxibacter everestensis]|uniref:DivIVA domain-containing protein n=1 Tax=Saxibacter everestensis TaxID=2909229 RepID=A0ABY8QVP4_9MICO|nr:DivIVA domain-containing protein [Brevibacteriaceae bacterium ZFBP1038]
MSTTFPTMSGWKNGYDPDQVDRFFTKARESFERDVPEADDLTAQSVRTVGFDLVRKGYHVAVVDAALDRLEDAFAQRQRDRLIQQRGQDAWMAELSRSAASLRGRLERPDGERFNRAARGEVGYEPADVDALCEKLRGYFNDGVSMSVDESRRAVFRTCKGEKAYDEDQVDAFLDRVVEVMAAVD